MTDIDAAHEAETARQVSRMADEILDYRATLKRIGAQAATDDLMKASLITLGERLVLIRAEAKAALCKDRR